MVAAVVGIGTAVAGAYSASQGAKSQGKAVDAQERAAEAQAKVGEDQLSFAKSQYADWQKKFDPAIGMLGSLAMKQVRPDTAAVAADVGNAFDTSAAIGNRNMERMGIRPTDGAYQTAQTQNGLGRALATVSGDRSARLDADNQNWNHLAGFAGMGMGQQGALLNSTASASNGLMGALGNKVGMYGGLASMYGASAAAGAGAIGRGLGMAFGSGTALGGLTSNNWGF